MPATTKKKASSRRAIDKQQLITDKIISLIDGGVKPWSKPWHSIGYGNAITGHEYQGGNPLLCAIDCLVNDYQSPHFIGFAQAKEQGWKIKKGSASTWLLWAGTVTKERENDQGEKAEHRFTVAKWLNVFNLDCIDDSESDRKVGDVLSINRTTRVNVEPRLELAEKVIAAQGIEISYGGDCACYSPTIDKIRLPKYEDFKGAVSYYATALHEEVHATGHSTRLGREMSGGFGSQAYAYEELIADLGAAFLCNELKMEPDIENHASYLDSWLKVLKNDKKAFFNAMREAHKAVEYIRAKSGLND